jgi:hypothetical protein
MAFEHGKVRTRDPERNGAGKSEPPMNRNSGGDCRAIEPAGWFARLTGRMCEHIQ